MILKFKCKGYSVDNSINIQDIETIEGTNVGTSCIFCKLPILDSSPNLFWIIKDKYIYLNNFSRFDCTDAEEEFTIFGTPSFSVAKDGLWIPIDSTALNFNKIAYYNKFYFDYLEQCK